MSEVEIRIPDKLIPVFQGRADVRGAYGGRGSAKTRSFAKMAAFFGMRFGQAGVTGQILCARQYMNSLDDSSLEEVKRAIEDEPILSAYYDVGEKYVKSRDGRIWFSFAGLDRSINSVKSKGRILICWVDEAEPVTPAAWDILEPTLREENEGWNAELWVTWNPARKNAAVESRYRNSADPLVKIAEINWRDNKKFPAVLERKRLRCLEDNPDQYEHIWEGDYVTIVEGAYFSKQLAEAKAQGRIGVLAADPLLPVRAYVDIGGTSSRSDAFTMWMVQFVGEQIRVLDYYEAVGQEIGEHCHWLRSRGYERALIRLPHDGVNHDRVHRVTYESAFREAGFDALSLPQMGTGAASARVEAIRRVFPQIHFNAATTEAGREALGWYHEKKDENRGIGLGPDHDWSSHAADAFGLMAVDHAEQPRADHNKPLAYRRVR